MDMVRLDPPVELTMPIGEAMFSQRATRRLDPDRPITDAQLKVILDAASKAVAMIMVTAIAFFWSFMRNPAILCLD